MFTFRWIPVIGIQFHLLRYKSTSTHTHRPYSRSAAHTKNSLQFVRIKSCICSCTACSMRNIHKFFFISFSCVWTCASIACPCPYSIGTLDTHAYACSRQNHVQFVRIPSPTVCLPQLTVCLSSCCWFAYLNLHYSLVLARAVTCCCWILMIRTHTHTVTECRGTSGTKRKNKKKTTTMPSKLTKRNRREETPIHMHLSAEKYFICIILHHSVVIRAYYARMTSIRRRRRQRQKTESIFISYDFMSCTFCPLHSSCPMQLRVLSLYFPLAHRIPFGGDVDDHDTTTTTTMTITTTSQSRTKTLT